MQQLSQWPLADRQRISGVFTDIDDTLTTDGTITPDALAAMHELEAAGFEIIAITGRPVGWSEPFVLDWPVNAIVAENGAVLLQNSYKNSLQPNEYGRGQLLKSYRQGDAVRAGNYARMQHVGQRVLREVPGALMAQDSAGRETDMAIDHSEFTQLPPRKIAPTSPVTVSAPARHPTIKTSSTTKTTRPAVTSAVGKGDTRTVSPQPGAGD